MNYKLIINIFSVAFILTTACLVDDVLGVNQGGERSNITVSTNGGPLISVTPREIDFGTLSPGDEVTGTVYVKNMGEGTIGWNLEVVGEWAVKEYRPLSGTADKAPHPIRVTLTFLSYNKASGTDSCTILLKIDGGSGDIVLRRESPLGQVYGALRIKSSAGTAVVFYQARLSTLGNASALVVDPLRLDFGTVGSGEQVTQRIHIRNRGKGQLKWRAVYSGSRGRGKNITAPVGRYISFRNNAISGHGIYITPTSLRDNLDLIGPWSEANGFPTSQDDKSAMRYKFSGRGISIFVQRTPDSGSIGVFLNDQLVDIIDCYSESREIIEIPIAENQPDGVHQISIVNRGGHILIEGVKIFGRSLSKGRPGWISIFPDSGVTTRETDYVNVQLNTNSMGPGIYGEKVIFESNFGNREVEVFLEVLPPEARPQLLEVHLYVNGNDYLYTTKPELEAERLKARGYRSLGTVFRLYPPGTSGTTEFYRWYNPSRGDHYYSSNPAGGGISLNGYIFEGTIGNIATSRLSGTRELYRWYNQKTRTHYYSTNQSEEILVKKGYHLDGIAGFVR